MDFPFLTREAQSVRAKRSQAIADEVYQFFKALAAALPYYEAEKQGIAIPKGKVPGLPKAPEILSDLDAVEEWGLPNPGTWLDQPADYMEDIEAAKKGRERYREEQRQSSSKTPGKSVKLDAFEKVVNKAAPMMRR